MTCSKCGETQGEPVDHHFENGICTTCGAIAEQEWTPLTLSGTGNQTIPDIKIGYDYYTLHVTHSGTGNFELKMTDATGADAILVHTSGNYDGTVLMYGASPLTFSIAADGNWTYEIGQVESSATPQFSGSGDSVTSKFSASSGKFHITHSGAGAFYVYAFYPGSAIEVVKPGSVSGKFDKTVDLTLPDGIDALFEVHADGPWAISKE